MVGDVEVAEDLTQEAFLLLFRKIVIFVVIPRFQPGSIALR